MLARKLALAAGEPLGTRHRLERLRATRLKLARKPVLVVHQNRHKAKRLAQFKLIDSDRREMLQDLLLFQ